MEKWNDGDGSRQSEEAGPSQALRTFVTAQIQKR
jgi:hypothetical protein